MILVVTHTAESNLYDGRGNLTEKKGTVTVSHGINIDTGRTVILPNEPWNLFRHNCTAIHGEWYLV